LSLTKKALVLALVCTGYTQAQNLMNENQEVTELSVNHKLIAHRRYCGKDTFPEA